MVIRIRWVIIKLDVCIRLEWLIIEDDNEFCEVFFKIIQLKISNSEKFDRIIRIDIIYIDIM